MPKEEFLILVTFVAFCDLTLTLMSTYGAIYADTYAYAYLLVL